MHDSSVEELIEQFQQLPGIGRKGAERIAFHILEKMSFEDVSNMTDAVLRSKQNIKFCPVCQNLTAEIPCRICSSEKRDKSIICVVENPEDVSAIEATQEFSGTYHVLHGVLSPMDGVTPEDLSIKELLARLDENVKEVIMATNPTVNGTATAVYISKLLAPFGVKVTRIAHGVPIGSDLEYADKLTLIKAIEGRQII